MNPSPFDPLDAVRCRLVLTGSDDIAPAEVLRQCRGVSGADDHRRSGAGDLYAALLAEGDLVPVDTLFGGRLAVTAALVERAEAALAASAPVATPLDPRTGVPFGTPTLLHDLMTVAGFVAREEPRVTGRGLLSAPALRRLAGLGVTAEAAVPLLERRAPDGSRLWQFLFRFLCAGGDVTLGAGRAHARPDLLDAIAFRPEAWAAALFTFAAARLPVADTAWIASLRTSLPARLDPRRIQVWLEALGIAGPESEASVERTLALLSALGFVRIHGPREVCLLGPCERLWSEGEEPAQGPEPPAPDPAATMALPGGARAIDLAVGSAALRARVPFERAAAPEGAGHVVLYGAGAGQGAEARPQTRPLSASLAGVVTGADEALVAAVADAMSHRVLGRWPGGMAVDVLSLEEAIERLEALGARVARRAPGASPSPAPASDGGPQVTAALPWTLARCRTGTWQIESGPGPRPLRNPAPFSPAEADALPTASARLRAAARLGWLVELVLRVEPEGAGDVRRLGLPLDVRWQEGDEWLDLLWAEGREEAASLPLAAIRQVRLHRADAEDPTAAGQGQGES